MPTAAPTPPAPAPRSAPWGALARALASRAAHLDWWGFFAGRASDEATAAALGWASGAGPTGRGAPDEDAARALLERTWQTSAVGAVAERLGLDEADGWLLTGLVALDAHGPVREVLRQRSAGGLPAWRLARWLLLPAGQGSAEIAARLAPGAALRRSGVLQIQPEAGPGADRVQVAPAVLRFVVEGQRAARPEAPTPWAEWSGQDAVFDALSRRLSADPAEPVAPGPLLVLGEPGGGRRSAVLRACAHAGRPRVVLRPTWLGRFDTLSDCLLWAQLNDALLWLDGDLQPDVAAVHRLAACLEDATPRPPCVITARPEQARDWLAAWPALTPEVWPKPNLAGRQRLVQLALEALGWQPDPAQPAWLARTYAVQPRDLWFALRDLGPGGGQRLDERALDARLRARVRSRLAALADPIEVHEGWDALVLAPSQRAVVDEIVAHAQHGHTVLAQWGFEARFGPRHGVACLFSGPPGTGKTLTAGLIAQSLGLPAFRVDLARVVDKYVGETEKNLGRLFDEAERVPVVLVFDEADALFGERTEQKSSQDRYANLEVNYLLQRMERFGGISVLTTNRAAVIDPAFRRRLRFHVHFDLPDAADRERLWAAMIPPGCLLGTVDFKSLGQRWRISGALIRKAVLRGAFLAAARGQALDGALLDEATRLELAEAGRLASEP